MQKMMKVAALFAAMVLTAGFAACSNGDGSEKDLSQTAEVFTVKYEVAGLANVTMKDGAPGKNIQKNPGETFTADELWEVTLKDTYKDGYTFGGWYMDAECTVPFAAFQVTQHTTLYAKFTAANGAAAIRIVTYKTEKSYMDAKRTVADRLPPSYLGCPPTSVADGMYFTGWFTDEDCKTRAEPGAPVGENGMTLYAKWTETLPAPNATLAGILSKVDSLYARSKDKNKGTGEYDYTPLEENSGQTDYYLITGVSRVGGALVFSKAMGNVLFHADSTKTDADTELRLGNSLNSSNVTLVESLSNYVCVRPTGAGTVTATLTNVPSSSVTGTSNAKALLIDETGTVLKTVAINNAKGTEIPPVTLSCTVGKTCLVYLAFERYGDGGGQLGVKEITFTPSTAGSGGEVPVVANLPASVGTDPFKTGTYIYEYENEDGRLDWDILFREDGDFSASGECFKFDITKNSIEFLGHGSDEIQECLLKYAYDDTKKEIYLALSKRWWHLEGDDYWRLYLWTRDEIFGYLRSIIGKRFYDDYHEDFYTYTQADYDDEKERYYEDFGIVVTYGYEKSADGSITLTHKSGGASAADVTLTLQN